MAGWPARAGDVSKADFGRVGSLPPPGRFRCGVREGSGMARAYTAELRDRVLRASERGGLSRARVAALFGVGESTLYRWRRTWQVEGRREAKPHARGPAPRPGGGGPGGGGGAG